MITSKKLNKDEIFSLRDECLEKLHVNEINIRTNLAIQEDPLTDTRGFDSIISSKHWPDKLVLEVYINGYRIYFVHNGWGRLCVFIRTALSDGQWVLFKQIKQLDEIKEIVTFK